MKKGQRKPVKAPPYYEGCKLCDLGLAQTVKEIEEKEGETRSSAIRKCQEAMAEYAGGITEKDERALRYIVDKILGAATFQKLENDSTQETEIIEESVSECDIEPEVTEIIDIDKMVAEQEEAVAIVNKAAATRANNKKKIKALIKKTTFGEYEDLQKKWVTFCKKKSKCFDIKIFQEKRIELETVKIERDNKKLAEIARKEKKTEEERLLLLPQLVLADPPWKYEHSKSDSRQIENQYPTASLEDIVDHNPETNENCILFLWAVAPKLPEAIQIMEGWGFNFVTSAVWDKGKIGMGYWFRGQHELLLVGRKGKMSPPEQVNRVSSVFKETRGEHSVKPECVYKWIEAAFPDLNKLEMYCRNKREGWEVFGNESA